MHKNFSPFIDHHFSTIIKFYLSVIISRLQFREKFSILFVQTLVPFHFKATNKNLKKNATKLHKFYFVIKNLGNKF